MIIASLPHYFVFSRILIKSVSVTVCEKEHSSIFLQEKGVKHDITILWQLLASLCQVFQIIEEKSKDIYMSFNIDTSKEEK